MFSQCRGMTGQWGEGGDQEGVHLCEGNWRRRDDGSGKGLRDNISNVNTEYLIKKVKKKDKRNKRKKE